MRTFSNNHITCAEYTLKQDVLVNYCETVIKSTTRNYSKYGYYDSSGSP